MDPTGVSASGEKKFFGLGKDHDQLIGAETKGDLGSQNMLESFPRSLSARPPMMETANPERLSPSEHAVACFAACPLKRIDPALRSGQGAVDEMDEEVVGKLHCDQMEAAALPIMGVPCEEGGEVRNTF